MRGGSLLTALILVAVALSVRGRGGPGPAATLFVRALVALVRPFPFDLSPECFPFKRGDLPGIRPIPSHSAHLITRRASLACRHL